MPCPSCNGTRDSRAKTCRKCHHRDRPPRLGTGKGWYLHKQTGYIIGYINGVKHYQHRYVMEQHLGRQLYPGECVHHINENKTDNRLENLELTTLSEHMRMHSKDRDMKSLSALAHKARWGYENS